MDSVKMMVDALRAQQAQAAMPFPNNHNPDMDFANRWPVQLPPSGVMNDLKPQIEMGPPMVRRLPGG